MKHDRSGPKRPFERDLESYSSGARSFVSVRRRAAKAIGYSAAVSAASVAGIGVEPLDASVIQGNLVSSTFSVTASAGGKYFVLNLDGDANDDFTLRFFAPSPPAVDFVSVRAINAPQVYFPGASPGTGVTAPAMFRGIVPTTGGGGPASNLGLTATVGPGQSFLNAGRLADEGGAGNFASSVSGFLGFRFCAGGTGCTANSANFGALQIHVSFQAAGPTVRIIDSRYESVANTPYHVFDQAVPEPSTVGLMGLGLLAFGARGLRDMRRRKAAAKKKQPA